MILYSIQANSQHQRDMKSAMWEMYVGEGDTVNVEVREIYNKNCICKLH